MDAYTVVTPQGDDSNRMLVIVQVEERREERTVLEVGIPCRCLLGEAHTSKGGRAGGRLS